MLIWRSSNVLSRSVWIYYGDADRQFGLNRCEDDADCGAVKLEKDENGHQILGVSPWNLQAANIDGDEDLDLVVAIGNKNADNPVTGERLDEFTVLRNDGNRKFTPRDFDARDNPRDVALAYVNDDDKVDVILPGRQSNDVAVYLNEGDEQNIVFREKIVAQASESEIATKPFAITAAHLNDDDLIDLAVVSDKSEVVNVLLATADGDFEVVRDRSEKRIDIPVGLDPEGITHGDLNGDDLIDLIVTNEDPAGDISILLGRGDGTFNDEIRVRAGSDPSPLAVVQLNDDNGDGVVNENDILDVVVPNRLSSDISVLLGRGDGTFHAREQFTVGVDPESLVAADFNGDGWLDIAAANRVSNDVSVLFGRGDGTFETDRRFKLEGSSPIAIRARDLNGDGDIDIATENWLGDYSALLWDWQTGEFIEDASVLGLETLFTDPMVQTPGPELTVGRFRADAIAVADFNDDGDKDFAVVTSDSEEISVRLGNGEGGFQAEQRYWTGNGDGRRISVGHFNGDKHLDLVIGHSAEGIVTFMLGDGQGGFQTVDKKGKTSLNDFAEILIKDDDFELSNNVGSIETVLVGHFNDDDVDDLAVFISGSGNSGIVVYHGTTQPDQLAQDLDTPPLPSFDLVYRHVFSDPSHPRHGTLGDFNDDGHVDLAVLDKVDDKLRILLGNGMGEFNEESPLESDKGNGLHRSDRAAPGRWR